MKYFAVGLLMCMHSIFEAIATGILYVAFGFNWVSEKIYDTIYTLKKDLK